MSTTVLRKTRKTEQNSILLIYSKIIQSFIRLFLFCLQLTYTITIQMSSLYYFYLDLNDAHEKFIVLKDFLLVIFCFIKNTHTHTHTQK